MEMRPLGHSGLNVSKLSLGAMSFGTGFTRSTVVDEALSYQIVNRALDAGINLIDTAETYGGGVSEEILGRAIRGRRDEVLLLTKVGFADLGPGALAYDKVISACEASLRRLGVETIDLYMLHRADRATPLEETLRALEDLVARGLVREIGASNFRAWEVAGSVGRQRALGQVSFSAVQVYYSLVGRDIEHEILPQCRTNGLGVLVYSSLAGGLLTSLEDPPGAKGRRAMGAFPPIDPEVRRRAVETLGSIAEAHGASRAQIAMAWVLAQPGVTSVIIGARSIEQLEDSLATASITLDTDEIARLNAVAPLAPIYPEFVDQRWGFQEPS